jgi:hypothetical protein
MFCLLSSPSMSCSSMFRKVWRGVYWAWNRMSQKALN